MTSTVKEMSPNFISTLRNPVSKENGTESLLHEAKVWDSTLKTGKVIIIEKPAHTAGVPRGVLQHRIVGVPLIWKLQLTGEGSSYFGKSAPGHPAPVPYSKVLFDVSY